MVEWGKNPKFTFNHRVIGMYKFLSKKINMIWGRHNFSFELMKKVFFLDNHFFQTFLYLGWRESRLPSLARVLLCLVRVGVAWVSWAVKYLDKLNEELWQTMPLHSSFSPEVSLTFRAWQNDCGEYKSSVWCISYWFHSSFSLHLQKKNNKENIYLNRCGY